MANVTPPPGGYGPGTQFVITPTHTQQPFSLISGVQSYEYYGVVSTFRTVNPLGGNWNGSCMNYNAYHNNTLVYFKFTQFQTLFTAGETIVIVDNGNIIALTIAVIHAQDVIEVVGQQLLGTTIPQGGFPFFEPLSQVENYPGEIVNYEWALSNDGVTPSTAWAPIAEMLTYQITGTSTNYILWRANTTETPTVWHEEGVLQYYHVDETLVTTTYVPDPDCEDLECDDPFSVDGGAVIEVDCSTNTFQPYAQNKSVNLYKQLNNIVSDIFGHQVNYFRTEPHNRTKDVTLMEYSLFNVADNKNLNILVPDNEFPSEANTYDIFGMEFAEFEVHIVHEKFKDIFGDNVRPRAKDYLFIPIINKMYEVSSVSIADEFNATRSYWRVMLKKYQDRSSVIKGTWEDATDNLITGIDEVFSEEIQDEQKKDTNPVQFQTVSKVLEDGERIFMNSNLTINDEAIVNDFTTISNNYYDLSKVPLNSPALRYSTPSKSITDGQLAITAWFRPTFEINDGSAYRLIQCDEMKIWISTDLIVVNCGLDDVKWTHNTNMSKDKWFGLVVNFNNNTQTVDFALFGLDVDGHVSQLITQGVHSAAMVNGPYLWDNGINYSLAGGKLNVTNIRVFDKKIEAAQYANMLNQYVVHDNQHALVVDNAIPSLGYQRFKNSR